MILIQIRERFVFVHQNTSYCNLFCLLFYDIFVLKYWAYSHDGFEIVGGMSLLVLLVQTHKALLNMVKLQLQMNMLSSIDLQSL